ncbi:uncharacterized protein EV422DRAFT_521911 [Fimicolochytrium jonesii]|uniref:uncharacterized protein n=1 Tax=Fimicolochytrium jonesii TaxID=1396493 RepID=UPI0022FF07D3|nr:uncharacterized protein EV422DRAFT_521911 [Fimicolochytrium jonesii]KAI8823666.1 hypothetical protein EV422DRAFT_521911 [Fimicolochytrium jonesii]
MPELSVVTSPASPGASSAQKDESGLIRVQLIPHSDVAGRPPIGDVIERTFKEGTPVRIGRQVLRDGQPAVAKGQKAPQEQDVWFSSKVVSRNHAEMWVKDGQIYIKDIGSSSGTFLNKMRLSPSGKESRPYPLKEGDLIQFGIDYKGKPDDVYKSITLRIGFYDQSWVQAQRRKANPVRFRTGLKMLLAAANPFGSSNSDSESDIAGSTDCCICIGAIGPFQALFVAPCSHCYHYKCVHGLLAQSAMFQCPMCRQVANLAASVSTDSLFGLDEEAQLDAAMQDGPTHDISPPLSPLEEPGDDVSATYNADSAIASAGAAPRLARLQLEQIGTASGDATPRNYERSASASISPESDATSTTTAGTIRNPVERLRQQSSPTSPPQSGSAGTPATSAVSEYVPQPSSGTSTPDRPNTASPERRQAKRRSSSLTSKLNALLRRGGEKPTLAVSTNAAVGDTSASQGSGISHRSASPAPTSPLASHPSDIYDSVAPVDNADTESEVVSPPLTEAEMKRNMTATPHPHGLAMRAEDDDISAGALED